MVRLFKKDVRQVKMSKQDLEHQNQVILLMIYGKMPLRCCEIVIKISSNHDDDDHYHTNCLYLFVTKDKLSHTRIRAKTMIIVIGNP